MRRTVLAVLSTLALLLLSAAPAAAWDPVNVVHTERVQVGPYPITVGFSTWPVRALQSLDFTFAPDGGIAGKSGELELENTASGDIQGEPLARHPRKREVWGLDVRSLPTPGSWTPTLHCGRSGRPGHRRATQPHRARATRPAHGTQLGDQHNPALGPDRPDHRGLAQNPLEPRSAVARPWERIADC